MNKNIRNLFIFFLVIFSFRFFDANFLNEHFINYISFFFVFFAIVLTVPFIFPKREGFVLPIQLIVLSALISIQMSHMSWGQSYMNGIIGTTPFLIFVFFFYLLHHKISIEIIEKITILYGILYVILYLFQFAHSGTVFFGSQEFKDDRGIIRIIFPGAGLFFLAAFLSINKLTNQNRNRWLWIGLSLLGILIPIMQVTRQLIAAVLLIYLYHFIKDQEIYRKVIILAVFFSALLYISQSDNDLIKGLTEAQKETSQEGKDNIRIVAATYFLTEFSPNTINRIFGNGVSYDSDSYYGHFVANLQEEGIYFSDVGIIAMYAMFGVLSVFAYILIWIKSFTLPISKELYYVKYYLWFLLITSFTSFTVYDSGYLIATVFAIYIYQTNYAKQKVQELFRSKNTEYRLPIIQTR